MNINFSTAARIKFYAQHIISGWELIPCLWLKRWASFPQAAQVEVSLSNIVGERDTVFSVSSGMYRERPDSKEGRISLQWLKFRLLFHVTSWRDVWILCGDPRGNPSSPPHLDRGPHIPWHLERPVDFKASKADEAWLFLKIDWNANISVETRNGPLVSHLTSRSVCIILPSLV